MNSAARPRTAHSPALAILRIVGLLAIAGIGVVLFLATRDTDEVTDQGGGWLGPLHGEPGVVYELRDAAVADDDDRSYTLTVWRGTARLVVRSGDDVQDIGRPIDDELWQRTLAQAMDFASAESVRSDDCSVGISEELTVLDGDKAELVHVFVDNCGVAEGPRIQDAVSDVLAQFDLATLLPMHDSAADVTSP
ncbi:MAG: hypothetical protein IPL07_04595 [Acidimicrobiaceae bacterium]|nr:hypothetical protein [Acidimicrobiaceae bacterium]